ncbi:efflux RND transporter permease subunit, partial [Balneolaceae bacterium ANBcel3]|nr:efflux RND transporter permease subunit [Balneolaceae bacterium ANBcel3]
QTIGSISQILAGRNIDESIGNITSYEYDILARTQTRFTSHQDVANTLIPARNSGKLIPLKDMAEVKDAHREQRLFAFLNDTESVQISVMKQPQANTVRVIDNLRNRLDELQATGYIPSDYHIEVIRDDSFFITSSIRSVTMAALSGAILAMIIILLFLGSLRRSVIVALMIPVAIIATFVLMNAGGLTLNIMSLGGLALAVGLLIDNAIVMIENIYRHQTELNKSPVEAAKDGSREVLSAVVAGTMTNLAAVLPFLLVTGLAALLFRELIFTIAFALLISLLTAITLIPAIMARFSVKNASDRTGTKKHRLFEGIFQRIRAGYTFLLEQLLKQRILLILLTVLLLAGSIWVIRGLSTEFLPSVDDGRITFRFSLPYGTSIEPSNEVAEIIRETIEAMPHVESQYMTVGGYFRGGQISVRGGMIDGVVQLVPHQHRRGYSAEKWVSEFRGKMREHRLPFIQERVRGPRIEGLQTSLTDADIAVGIIGDDLEQLDDVARSVMREIEHLRGISSIQIGRDAQIPQLVFRIDEDRASNIHLTSLDVASLLHGAVNGSVPTQFVEGGFEYDLRVRYSRDITGTVDGLLNIPVMNEAGQTVPLGSLVSFEEITGPAHIERFNQIRVVWINTIVDINEATMGDVGEEIRSILSEFTLPNGISMIYAGEQEAIEESRRSLQLAIILAIFFVFVVMAIQYEKIFSPIVILLSLPFALIGVAAALWITGMALSASVLLGLVFLTGIIVNNAILLVDFAENHRKQSDSTAYQAITEAANIRFRPILMTSATTIFGMLPLAIGIGEGYEILQPLAITVIGGMIAGTVLTLLILPGIYVTLAKRAR